ncbi:MAG: flagellar filament capping protein FliD [Acinetobacter sp.]|nr:flagellar filament capping protein FliD [Acinetobacter sp.]
MSISFSGLSSGIDTSSWVESLVALRQAKVTKLEEEKESVVSIQDVLSNIKSFFTSFRSTIEKVTDAKFGIVSMDLFAQNLATSSNINVLTGTATTEAEEATYNIQVDKLASSTEAASNQNFTTTVIETATATLGTKLSDIGVKTGQIGVTSNGNQYKISITEEDTIKSLIDKLQAVGVDANYNEKTGIFSANIDASDIDDSISNTGIVDAFHLSDSVGGYGSGKLETSDTDTLVTTATGSTKLRMLGVEAGTLTMEANGAEYSFQVTDKTTIQEFVDAMKSVNIDASFNNGVLSIVDAEITDEGTTNIISALGLETKVNQNTQTSGGLSYTEVKTAGLNNKITEFISGSSGVVNVYDKTGVQLGSVTISDSTTFEGFFDRLEDYGIKGRLEDGVISFSSVDGNYLTGGLMDKLGVGVVTTTITTTSGSGVSSGGSVSYDTVKDETTTDYTTTTTTTTSTSTSGMGMTSDTTIDYSTVRLEETIVTYETVITTTTLTTLTSGGSDGKIIETTVLYSTINALSTTTVVTTIGTVTTTTTTTVTQSLGTRAFVNGITRIDVSAYQALSSVNVGNNNLSAGTYAINSAADLQKLAELTNNGKVTSANTFILGADIDLSGVENWTPIGNSYNFRFQGIFNGNGYEIQNLKLTSSSYNGNEIQNGPTDGYAVGLFGYLYGEVKNLGVSNVNISSRADYVGGLAGYLGDNITLNNCYVTGSVTRTNDYADAYNTIAYSATGGLVGYMAQRSIVKASHADVSLTANNTMSVIGTLAGVMGDYSTIENSYAKGSITGGKYTGGLVGSVYNSNITIKSSFTNVTVAGNNTMGGILGSAYNSNLMISNTQSGGLIKNNTSNATYITAGGIVGLVTVENSRTVSILNCTTNASINISTTSGYEVYTGGIIASSSSSSSSSSIVNSYVLGYSPDITGIFIGSSGVTSTKVTGGAYNANFNMVGKNIIGNNTGTFENVNTCGTDTPFVNSYANLSGVGSSSKSEANTEIIKIVSIDVNTSTVFETSTAIDVKTETIKSTATITSTSSEIQYKYTTISGEFMNAITRIDTVNMTSLSDIKALNGALESGTYAIRTTEDLKLLQNWSNLGFLTGNYYFVLGDNINLMNQSWTPIANSYSLNATFDGNGYEISNLSIKGSYGNAGLFGQISEVKNLGLRNVIVNNTNSSGNTGAIAGNCTTLTNCYITGSGSVTGSGTTGGLLGKGTTITSCYSNINVFGNGSCTGGLIGSIYSGATIAFSYITGNVTANSGDVGLFSGSSLTPKSSYATGILTKNGTVINGYHQNASGTTSTSIGNSSFYKNTSGKYVFNGSTLSSMPYNYDTKSDIVDVRAPYKVIFSTTYTASGTEGGAIVTTNISTKTETITELQTVPVTSSVAMTAETTFSQLGMTSDNETISGVYNGKAFTLTITSADTVGDIASALGDYGITATVRGGRIYINDSENAYITNISSAVKNALGITASMGNGSSYTVTTHTTVTTNTIASQTTIHVTSTVQMSEETKFSEIGMNSDNEYIKGSYNGKNFSIAVTRSDTVGDIIEALADYGINASVRGGKIYINESENAYITSFSNGIKNALAISASGGSGSTYTITTIKTYANTAPTNNVLGKVTVTSAVTRNTALSDLGVTTGEYNIWNNGVKYTALISSDETVGSLLDTLAQFGIQASIVNNGNTSTIRLTGNGNAYVAKSASINNASNVVDVLFPSANKTTTYNYNGNLQIYSTVTTHTTATEDTLLSEFDTPWGNTTLKNAGILALEVNGESRNITITENDTFGTLIDKLQEAGAEAALIGGRLYISSANNLSINTAASTSALVNPNAAIKLTKTASLDDFTASDSAVVETETIIEEHTGSAASYANLDTKLGLLNISSGTISIYKNGVKATINVNEDQTFSDLRAQISAKFSDVDLSFEDGYLVLKSSDKNAELDFGSTTDTSNFLAITGLKKDKDDKTRVTSARQLYCVNADSKVTEAGLFKKGDVTAGTFFVGDQKFTIDENTTISDIISMINSSEDSNATAYWDSINAQLVIKSRTTGAALINIEAGTSNFTDILGFTQSEWNADGTLKSTKLKVDSQTLGSNAEFRINGTLFTATSNTIGSDISRIKGVTIDLKGLTEGSAVTLTVERDKESLASAISDVVDSYNELMTNVDKELAVDGSLHSESMLKLIRNRLRSIMTSSDAGAAVFRNLNQIGITTDKASAGSISTSNITKLTFDKDKFFDALKADEDAVKALIIGGTDNTGIFTKVEELLEDALRSVSGYFDSTANSLQNKAKRIDKKIAAENTAIEKYKARLENKFNSMDMLIGQMQNQYSSFLGS